MLKKEVGKMPQYKIFSAKISHFGETGTVIISAFFNAGGYPRAESFVLVPDGKTTLAKRFRFDVKSFNDSPVELNEDFMLEQALGHYQKTECDPLRDALRPILNLPTISTHGL